MKTRLYELDSLRGFAALMVVLGHYTKRFNELYQLDINFPFSFDYGQHGVQLFFLISGFVIFMTLNKTRHPFDFIVSRFSRLFPAYWFSVLLTFSIISVFSFPDASRIPTFSEAIINLTMLQRWLLVKNVDPVYWTLAVELSFYAIMFGAYLSKQLKRIELLSALYLWVIIAVEFFENYLNFHIPNLIRVSLILDYGNLFIAGIMFYKLIHESKLIHHLIILSCFSTEYYLHSDSLIFVGCFFLLFYAFVFGKLQFIAVRPLIFLGSISYSLYLTHQVIGYILLSELYKLGLDTPSLLLLIALSFSIALATAMYVCIEKPCQLLLRKIWRNSRKYQEIDNHFRCSMETR